MTARSWAAAAFAVLLVGCETTVPPPPSFTVIPAAVVPGEPLRVRFVDPLGDGDRRLTIEVRDAAGTVLARRELTPDRPANEVWLDPVDPGVAGDLEVRVRREPAKGRASVRSVRLPLDLHRPLLRPPLRGLGHEERSPDGPFRWTDGCATGEIEDLGADALLHIRYGCVSAGLRETRLRVGDHETVLGCAAGASLETARIPLGRSFWRAEPFQPFEIVTEPPFVPADEWGGTDDRELGIQIFGVVVTLDPNGPRER